MKSLFALYQATAREFCRDRTALLLTVLLPVVMAAFFGMIFGGDQGQAAPMSHTYLAGMLAIAALWLGVFATAPQLVQMRESQVLRRIGATPVSRATLLGAQVLWRLTTGLIQAALMVALGMAAYGLRIANWPLFLGFAVLGTLVFVALGFLMSSLGRSTEAVIALGQVVQFPMMFLSGAFMPLEMLPGFLRPVSVAMPLTYLVDALRQTMAAAAPLYPLWLDATVLAGCLAACSLLAVRLFRWE